MGLKLSRVAVAPGLLLLLSACPSLTTMHTARPIEPGRTQLGGSAVVFGTKGDGASSGILVAELHIRHGFSETFDFGVKVYPVGVQVDFNILVVDSESFAMSLDPSFSGIGGAGGIVLYAWLPLLMDVVNNEAVTLTIGPKVGVMLGAALAGGSGAALATGAMAGLKIKITETFAVMPEADVYEVFGDGAKAVIWVGGIGVAF